LYKYIPILGDTWQFDATRVSDGVTNVHPCMIEMHNTNTLQWGTDRRLRSQTAGWFGAVYLL